MSKRRPLEVEQHHSDICCIPGKRVGRGEDKGFHSRCPVRITCAFSHSITTVLVTTHYYFFISCLAGEQAGTSSFLDLLLCKLGEVLGLDNNRNLDLSISKKLEVTLGDKINNESLARGGTLGCLVYALSGDIEELVNVQRWGEISVLQLVELAHTDFTEVTRVIFIEEGTVMVLPTGITTTTGMLSVLADTAMTHLDVAALLACFVEAGGHIELWNNNNSAFNSPQGRSE